jgi:FkbM family methyltransferase
MKLQSSIFHAGATAVAHYGRTGMRGQWRLVQVLRQLAPFGFAPKIVRRQPLPKVNLSWNVVDLRNNVDEAIFYYGAYERSSVARLPEVIGPGNVCLDVGANTGFYSVVMAHLVGDTGRVHSFEPSKVFRELLVANLAANDLRNVSVYPIGLSAHAETGILHRTRDTATQLAGVHPADKSADETIELDSLDARAEALALTRLDFIKLDIDGGEADFFAGAQRTMARFRPRLLLEVVPALLARKNLRITDLLRPLEDLGYTFEVEARQAAGSAAAIEAWFDRSSVNGANVFARAARN